MFDRETLEKLKNDILPVDKGYREKIKERWDSIAKPISGLGEFERIISLIGAIRGTEAPSIKNKALLIFISDNGIVSEGVSQCGSEVTFKVAKALSMGTSTSSIMAKSAGVKVIPVDVGMEGEKIPGLSDRRVRSGSRNFYETPAMTEEETLAAIEAGFLEAEKAIKEGADILLLGEMGIGNTSTATALSSLLLSLDPLKITGYGAGLSEEGRKRKSAVIDSALKKHSVDPKDTLKVLSTFGGFDIAALTGAVLCSAVKGIPAVTDGLITLAAALTAERLWPGVKDHLIPSIIPKEPLGKILMESLSLRGVIDADMALGEGTGGILLMPMLETCLALYKEGSTFSDEGIEKYKRFTPSPAAIRPSSPQAL